MENGTTSIPEFYDGRSVLVTGMTGFLGKVLVEKLLRACPGLECVYAIVRTKQGQPIHERLREIKDCELFQKLRERNPKALEKIVPMNGDIGAIGLGISEDDRRLLAEKVSVVFHSAATVRFNENLKRALEVNVRGTKELLELAKCMRNLKAFVYVSTAYAHCEHMLIQECFYPSESNYKAVMKCLDPLSDDRVNELTPTLIQGKPNTYVYSKAMAESILQEYSSVLPIAVFRPSIVLGTFREPMRGWIQNASGPTGLIIGCWMGLIHTVLCHSELRVDFVPVDMAVNCLIAAGWKRGTQRSTDDSCEFYNFACGTATALSWNNVSELGYNYIVNNPIRSGVFFPANPKYRKSVLMYWVDVYLYQMIPAYIMDLVAVWLRKQRRMVKLQKRIQREVDLLSFFTTNEWDFRSENVTRLSRMLRPSDKELFDFDLSRLDWKVYFDIYMGGVLKYILKETDKDRIEATRRIRRLYWLLVASKLLMTTAMYFLLRKRFPYIRKVIGI